MIIVSSDNFAVERIKNLIVYKCDSSVVCRSGWDIRDRRNQKLVNVGDDQLTLMNSRKNAKLMIQDGLLDGFTWFDKEETYRL